MMRLAALIVFAICFPSLALAQAKVDVRWQKNGVVRVAQARKVSRIDLADEISGCVGELFDRTVNGHYGSGLHKTQVLDVITHDGQHFVLLSAVAAPNCNVQGQCGAGDDDVTLIWLHLGADLAVVRKQSVVVEDCIHARAVAGPRDDGSPIVKLTAGSLKLRFHETTYGADKVEEISSEIVYDRQFASDGIRVTRLTQ